MSIKWPMTPDRLGKYLELKRELENDAERVKRERAALGLATQKLDAMPRSSSVGDRIGTGVPNIIAAEEYRLQWIGVLSEEAIAIERAINELPQPRDRDLMKLKYIDGLTWEKVAEELKISREWATKLHAKLIRENFSE